MAKSLFVTRFQNTIQENIQELLNGWFKDKFEVSTEDRYLPGFFKGIMDLCIYEKKTDLKDTTKIIAIEIEHKSGIKQAKRNIEKMKEWTHRSPSRQCSLLHLFSEDSNIDHDDISALVRYARHNQLSNHGFFYDFIFYKITDNRKTAEYAKKLVMSKDFITRLWMLMEDIGLVQI